MNLVPWNRILKNTTVIIHTGWCCCFLFHILHTKYLLCCPFHGMKCHFEHEGCTPYNNVVGAMQPQWSNVEWKRHTNNVCRCIGTNGIGFLKMCFFVLYKLRNCDVRLNAFTRSENETPPHMKCNEERRKFAEAKRQHQLARGNAWVRCVSIYLLHGIFWRVAE